MKKREWYFRVPGSRQKISAKAYFKWLLLYRIVVPVVILTILTYLFDLAW
jgi:hypothetical protein